MDYQHRFTVQVGDGGVIVARSDDYATAQRMAEAEARSRGSRMVVVQHVPERRVRGYVTPSAAPRSDAPSVAAGFLPTDRRER